MRVMSVLLAVSDFEECDFFQFTKLRRVVGMFVYIFGCNFFNIPIAWLTALIMPGFGLA